MADGTTKPIGQVQVGDQVLSRNPDTGKDEVKTVTGTIERHAPSVVDVVLHDAKTGKAETLTCTPEHPLYVQGQGWVEAGSVGIGTSIVSRAGPAMQVTDLTWKQDKAQELAAGTGSSFGGYTVYNLTVQDDHTFFVGTANGGTWVHNACPAGAGKIDLPEVKGPAVKAKDLKSEQDNFLGSGPRDDIHPRLGIPDPSGSRTVTQTGPNEWRSIRYGNHERNNSHYHEETWSYDPATNIMTVGNTYRKIIP